MEEIFSRIAQARKARGLTQAELAKKIGVHPTTVAKWETGSVRPGRYFPELCEVLDVTIDWLTYGGESKPPPIYFDGGVFPHLAKSAKEHAITFELASKLLRPEKAKDSAALDRFSKAHLSGLKSTREYLADLVVELQANSGAIERHTVILKGMGECALARADNFRRVAPMINQTDPIISAWLAVHQTALEDFANRLKSYVESTEKANAARKKLLESGWPNHLSEEEKKAEWKKIKGNWPKG